MRKFFAAAVISIGTICTANAAFADDWSGYNAGIFASRDAGSGDYFVNGVPQGSNLALVGKIYGAFAGYNFQMGSVVYGGEIAYSAGSTGLTIAPDQELTSFLDVKARLGYAFETTLLYGVIGSAFGVYERAGIEQLDTNSFSYGVGIDTMLTDRIFIGVEYLYRDLVTDNSAITPADHWEYRMDSLQIRAGIKF